MLEAQIHRAAIDWLNRHPDSHGLRNYFCIRLAALTFPVPGERVTFRQVLRIAQPRFRPDKIQVQIPLYASDIHASARFYKAVGFDLHYNEDPFGGPPCYVGDLGPTQMVIYQPAPNPPVSQGLRFGFRLDDLDGAIQRLTAAAVPLERPTPRNYLIASDPDGNRISLQKQASPHR